MTRMPTLVMWMFLTLIDFEKGTGIIEAFCESSIRFLKEKYGGMNGQSQNDAGTA